MYLYGAKRCGSMKLKEHSSMELKDVALVLKRSGLCSYKMWLYDTKRPK